MELKIKFVGNYDIKDHKLVRSENKKGLKTTIRYSEEDGITYCESEDQPLKVLFKVLRKGATIPVRNNGAAYDLFIPEDVRIEAGQTVKIGLGFSCKLPSGFHALINMRSSTWAKWGLCLSNQTGIIDNSYSGDSDEWILSVYRPNSFKDYPTLIPAGTRLAQFRLERDCPELLFEEVETLGTDSRGGFGSTGN